MITKFQDIYPSHDQVGYLATNEEPVLFRKLLDKRPVKKAGGIASGGEIPLFVFASGGIETVAVDHSYRALAACLFKIQALARLGPAKTKFLFTEEPFEKITALVKELSVETPDCLKTALNPMSEYNFYEVRREWFYTPLAIIAKAYKNLSKISLIHGDLSDLKPFGPFDCLYVSNASEHTGRDRKAPNLESFKELVGEDGLLATTSNTYAVYPSTRPPAGWELVKGVKGYRTSWTHTLLRRNSAARPQAAGMQAAVAV